MCRYATLSTPIKDLLRLSYDKFRLRFSKLNGTRGKPGYVKHGVTFLRIVLVLRLRHAQKDTKTKQKLRNFENFPATYRASQHTTLIFQKRIPRNTRARSCWSRRRRENTRTHTRSLKTNKTHHNQKIKSKAKRNADDIFSPRLSA